MRNIQHKKRYYVYVVAVVCLVVGFCIGYVAGFNYRADWNQVSSMSALSQEAPSQSSTPNLDLKAGEIVKELNCVCGCKMILSTCTCTEVNGSKELKLFVQDLVNRESAKVDILNRLKEKYGEGVIIKKQA